jgi:hypothetical protein
VDLVHHHRLQPGEQQRAIFMAEQQAQGFGCRQQDLRRPYALSRLAVGGGVAGPGLYPNRQVHLTDRSKQIALHVDR